MQCPNCREYVPIDAQFCTNCGSHLGHAVTGPTKRLSSEAQQLCPKCRSDMERGFIPDEYRNRNELSVWVQGDPERNPQTGELVLAGRTMWQIVTYRCTMCGYLESYAAESL